MRFRRGVSPLYAQLLMATPVKLLTLPAAVAWAPASITFLYSFFDAFLSFEYIVLVLKYPTSTIINASIATNSSTAIQISITNDNGNTTSIIDVTAASLTTTTVANIQAC